VLDLDDGVHRAAQLKRDADEQSQRGEAYDDVDLIHGAPQEDDHRGVAVQVAFEEQILKPGNYNLRPRDVEPLVPVTAILLAEVIRRRDGALVRKLGSRVETRHFQAMG
jgi:hypothetical protein